MAAQATAVANIYEPQIWEDYFLEETTEKSLLVQSGIAAADPSVVDAAQKGGRTVYMPFWDDLANGTSATTSSKVATDDDTSITPAGATTDEDVAVKLFRTMAWQAAPIVNYVAGSDPVAMFLDRYVNWWVREEQRILLKVLTGVFADATVATNLENNIAVETTTSNPDNLISSTAITDTRFKLGDAFGKLTGMIMHSVPFKRLVNLDLIDNVRDSQQDPTVMPTYMGLNVLVDDGMTVVAGSTSGNKYYTYLFGAGAIARAEVPLDSKDPRVELYREPLKGTGFGQHTVITRRGFILHPRGIKYGGSLTVAGGPSDADLSADNWTQVYLTKNIRLARLVTNG